MVTFETLKANCVHSGERSGFSDTCIFNGWNHSMICRADLCPLLGGERKEINGSGPHYLIHSDGGEQGCKMCDTIINLAERIERLEHHTHKLT